VEDEFLRDGSEFGHFFSYFCQYRNYSNHETLSIAHPRGN
jgi:hypothetical protein